MEIIQTVVNYVLSFKPYVLLPFILLIFSLIFHIPVSKAIKSSLTIGIGFIGIFIIFDYFVEAIGPAVQAMVSRTGLHFNVLDVGWTPLAAIAWSYSLAPLLIILIMLVNFIMLAFKLTKTVNIDIWNFWHFIFTCTMVYEATGNLPLALGATLFATVITLKLADWSAEAVRSFSGLHGISISTLSGVVYYPIGIIGDNLLNKVPYLRNLNADPDSIKRKLGTLGEPMVIGFLMGIILGIGSGYELKNVLELAFQISAVIFILPMMAGILGQGLMPISDGMKDFMKKKFPNIGETYIGLDLAVIIGNNSVIVTGLLLMPVALLLSFVLPGIKFIPLGDLANIIGAVVMVVVATKGNVIRSVIICIPIMAGKLYAATYMAQLYTQLAQKANLSFKGYAGAITSFLDGGNLFRLWILRLAQGNLIAILFIPVIVCILVLAMKTATTSVNNDLKD